MEGEKKSDLQNRQSCSEWHVPETLPLPSPPAKGGLSPGDEILCLSPRAKGPGDALGWVLQWQDFLSKEPTQAMAMMLAPLW